jgi:hypothetical protein
VGTSYDLVDEYDLGGELTPGPSWMTSREEAPMSLWMRIPLEIGVMLWGIRSRRSQSGYHSRVHLRCRLVSERSSWGAAGRTVLLTISIGHSRLAFHGPAKRSGGAAAQCSHPPSGSLMLRLAPKCGLTSRRVCINSAASTSAVG